MISRIREYISPKPIIEGPAKLPDFFPLSPKGCEHLSESLFDCISNKALPIAREMERKGVNTLYWDRHSEVKENDSNNNQKIKMLNDIQNKDNDITDVVDKSNDK